ncbi:MAG TPA: prevent-host-death protein [Gammaproteobacteria bacterium]|jgi:prevent-host-death family protein|nr:prevent-host-death protein [Gammaproteobacteria bacterium]
MKGWAVQEAKARFSELLMACDTDGPQLVTKRGVETAVLVPVDDWKRLQALAKPSLKALLLSKESRTNIPVLKRGQAKRRIVEII